MKTTLIFLFILTILSSFQLTQILHATINPIGQSIDSNLKEKGLSDSTTNTFSISGSIISTINPSFFKTQEINSSLSINKSNEKNLLDKSSIDSNSGIKKNVENFSDSLTKSQDIILPTPDFPSIPNSISNRSPLLTNSNNMSDNLVSILSGIIIQSLKNGNPTVNNNKIEPIIENQANNNVSIIVAGKWSFDNKYGNISKFDAKLVMITSNASGFHWHFLNNFTTDEKLIFDDEGNAIISGKANFFTGDNSTPNHVNIILSINNLELIQINFLDKNISDHFYGYPLYGVVDSIKINN